MGVIKGDNRSVDYSSHVMGVLRVGEFLAWVL